MLFLLKEYYKSGELRKMKSRQYKFLKENGILRAWNQANWKVITSLREWNEKVDFLERNGQRVETKRADADEWRVPFSFKIDTEYKKYYYALFFCDGDGDLNVWLINALQPNKPVGQGKKANKIFKSVFEATMGVTERKAFGYCDRERIHRCVPKQLYYINESKKNRNLKHVSKADFSSHYPASLCGRAPTWNHHVEVAGTVAPSEEYPFAFYVRSGHLAEYGVFDSHDWLDSPLWRQLFGDNYDPKIDAADDLTILCKASPYTYDETVTKIYEKKLNGEVINEIPAKIVLNASIGFKHLSNLDNTQNRLDHVAAICLGRANQKMLEKFERGRTLMIVVDCIIYEGKDQIGTDTKALGELHQEITDCNFRMRGTNQYAFADDDGVIIQVAHGGFDENFEIESLEAIDYFSKKDIIKLRS